MSPQLFILVSLLAGVAIAESKCVCDAGQFRSGGNACKPCPPGTFQDKQGRSTRCKPCRKNFASINSGATKCTPCGNRSIASKNTQSSCSCKKGFTVRNNSPEAPLCQISGCPPGQFVSEKADQTLGCSPCPAGSFKAKTGSANCSGCPPGTFSEMGAAECFKCNGEEAILDTGKCGKCATGQTKGRSGFCEECPEGTFKDKKGNGPCRRCPPKTESIRGSSKCLSCRKGDVPIRDGDTEECGSCRAGRKYEPLTWICSKCPFGTFSPAGKSLKPCEKCPSGTFSMGGAKDCTPCPNGKILLENKACAACPPGTRYVDFQFRCEKCEPNTFSPGGASQKCMPCANGKFSSQGSAKCKACPNGTAFIAKDDKCGTCSPGQFYLKQLAACVSCTDGISPSPSVSVDCVRCRPGSVPNESQTKCVDAQQSKLCKASSP